MSFTPTSGLEVRGVTPPLRLADFGLAAFDMDSTDYAKSYAKPTLPGVDMRRALRSGPIANFTVTLMD